MPRRSPRRRWHATAEAALVPVPGAKEEEAEVARHATAEAGPKEEEAEAGPKEERGCNEYVQLQLEATQPVEDEDEDDPLLALARGWRWVQTVLDAIGGMPDEDEEMEKEEEEDLAESFWDGLLDDEEEEEKEEAAVAPPVLPLPLGPPVPDLVDEFDSHSSSDPCRRVRQSVVKWSARSCRRV